MPPPEVVFSNVRTADSPAVSRQPRHLVARCPTLLFVIILAGLSTAASAQAPGAPAGDQPVPMAPVVIDGERLFAVRGISSYPAEQRAAGIAERIRGVAANDAIASSSLTIEERATESVIMAAGQPLLRIQDEDAAAETADRQLLAETYRAQIARAIDRYRADRQPARLWKSALFAIGATVVFIAAAVACAWIYRRSHRGLERRYRGAMNDLSIQSLRFLQGDQLWRGLVRVVRFAWGLTVAVMAFVYLRYTLGLFPWTRGTANQLADIATRPLVSMGQGIIDMIPNLVFLAILLVVTRYVLTLIHMFFDSIAAGSVTFSGFEREWAEPTYRLVRLGVIALAIVVAYPYIPGSETEAFKGVSVFVGIVFSLGSSSFIGNIISGYSMTYRRTFVVGDMVKLGDHVGKVMDVRLMATYLQTPRNEIVSVPNSVIVGADVVNYSAMAKDQGLILSTTVGIGYETPWRQVEAMLIEAATRTEGVLHDRQPFVQQTALGDFAVTYELNAYCGVPQRMRSVHTELRRSILDVFNEYGVQIMTPAYEGDPAEPKVVPKDRWFTEPARPESGRERVRTTTTATTP